MNSFWEQLEQLYDFLMWETAAEPEDSAFAIPAAIELIKKQAQQIEDLEMELAIECQKVTRS